jgi:hypothetical protein
MAKRRKGGDRES